MQAFGLAKVQGYAARGYFTDEVWLYNGHPFGRRTMSSALAGRYAIDARGLRKTAVGVLDLDVAHDVDPRTLDPGPLPPCDCATPSAVNDLDRFLDACRRGPCPHHRKLVSKAACMRRYVAQKARTVVLPLAKAARAAGALAARRS